MIKYTVALASVVLMTQHTSILRMILLDTESQRFGKLNCLMQV